MNFTGTPVHFMVCCFNGVALYLDLVGPYVRIRVNRLPDWPVRFVLPFRVLHVHTVRDV